MLTLLALLFRNRIGGTKRLIGLLSFGAFTALTFAPSYLLADSALEEVFWAIDEPTYDRKCPRATRDFAGYGKLGAAGFACNVDYFGDFSRSELIYSDFIVRRDLLVTQEELAEKAGNPRIEIEKTRYISKVVKLVTDLGKEYLKRRNFGSQISEEEMDAWLLANLARFYQESSFGHYRIGTNKSLEPTGPRFTVGDAHNWRRLNSFKSMGISQINIDIHHDVLESQAYFDLIKNIIEGYDYYYEKWARAKKALINPKAFGFSCQKQIRDFHSVGRSAYSAYRGDGYCGWTVSEGRRKAWEKRYEPKRRCRYPLYKSKRADYKFCENDYEKNEEKYHWNHDVDYYSHFTSKPWEKYYDNNQAIVSLDLNCIFDGDDFCLIPEESHSEYLKGKLIELPSTVLGARNHKSLCAAEEDSDNIQCVQDSELLGCMSAKMKIQKFSGMVRIDPKRMGSLKLTPEFHTNKYDLCTAEQGLEGLFPVGTLVKVISKNGMRVRQNPWVPAGNVNANKIGIAPYGAFYQILDFVFPKNGSQERWYKIRFKTYRGWKVGFIYGGDETNKRKWSKYIDTANYKEVEGMNFNQDLPFIGQYITVKNPNGLPLGKEDQLDYGNWDGFSALQKGKRIPVLDLKIISMGEINRVYAETSLEGERLFVNLGWYKKDNKSAVFDGNLKENFELVKMLEQGSIGL